MNEKTREIPIAHIKNFIIRTAKSAKYFGKALINGELPRQNLLGLMMKYSPQMEGKLSSNFRTCFTTFSTPRIGKSHYQDIEEMINRNPDWNFVFFDDTDVMQWMKKHAEPAILDIFLRDRYKASQMDIFRLCLVRQYGGIFLSLNRIIEKPFNQVILDLSKLVISFETNVYKRQSASTQLPMQFRDKQVVQWAIIGPKNHKFFTIALEEISRQAPLIAGKRFQSVKEAIWDFTAPRSLTRALDNYLAMETDQSTSFVGIDYEFSGREAKGAYVRYISNPSYLGDRNAIVLSQSIS